MNILIYGASGMVGQGVLRECLAAPDVVVVKAVGREPLAQRHPRLSDFVLPDLADYPAECDALQGFDACFYCLGVSAAGMSEQAYSAVNHDLTLAAARTLARLNPGMTFIYVSGAGTDSSEQGRTMWARVKGRVENALMRQALTAYMFRPGIIQPLNGIRSKTMAYRLFYLLAAPLLPLLRRLFPDAVLTTAQLGRAMLAVARHGASRRVLEARDIRALAEVPAPAGA
jgi:uncharacterized protein YbjT (DUF2867 family)